MSSGAQSAAMAAAVFFFPVDGGRGRGSRDRFKLALWLMSEAIGLGLACGVSSISSSKEDLKREWLPMGRKGSVGWERRAG